MNEDCRFEYCSQILKWEICYCVYTSDFQTWNKLYWTKKSIVFQNEKYIILQYIFETSKIGMLVIQFETSELFNKTKKVIYF